MQLKVGFSCKTSLGKTQIVLGGSVSLFGVLKHPHLIKPTTSTIAHLLNMIWTSPQKMKQQIV